MKKIVSLLLALVMLLSLAACGEEEKKDSTGNKYKDDIQQYITDNIDSSATITIFEKKSSEVNGDTMKVTCVAMYEGEAGEQKDEFVLTYYKDGRDWKLVDCNVAGGNQTVDVPEETNGNETPAPQPSTPAATTPPVSNNPTAVSDDWKDFTFSLEGVVYQLPCHYQTFVAKGWKLESSSFRTSSEDDKIPGYTRKDIYLTNGAVSISAEVVNLSGNTRLLKDCDIGMITIDAKDNLKLQMAGGVHSLSTVDEVKAAFGTPSDMNSYSDYTALKYKIDTYNYVQFYIYSEKTTYNYVTLCNMVAGERDKTTPKDERPAYLDTYEAPTELGSDVKSTRFILDGELYQLPCPLNAFTDNGWTIKSDSMSSLGAWNDGYGVTLSKDGYSIDLYMINLSDYEVYTEHCAVSQVSFSPYNFKNAPKDIVQLPGGVTMWTGLDEVASLYKGFNFYEGTYSTSYTYEDKDYTEKVYYSFDTDDEEASLTVKNEKWDY